MGSRSDGDRAQKTDGETRGNGQGDGTLTRSAPTQASVRTLSLHPFRYR